MIRPLFLAMMMACLQLPAEEMSGLPAIPPGTPVFNVRDFGAKGDGLTKDTASFQQALDACAAAGGGAVLVPTGYYLTGSLVLKSNTTLRLEFRANLIGSPDLADYPLVRVRWEGEFTTGHRALISADKADHIAIVGPGFIYGPPVSLSRLREPRGPCLIEVANSTDVQFDGFTTQYQQLWSIHTVFCRNLTARNLIIRSINFNADGIDVDSCEDVLIERCNIDTGDDAISLKSGRGMEAVRLARPTQNVVIRDCTLVSSCFAGLGLGTEMSGGIRNVRVENCVIMGHQNGIFIKSRDGRGGYMENIAFKNLTVMNSPTLVGINLVSKGIPASEPVTGDPAKWASVRNISFTNVKVSNLAELVAGENIPKDRLLDGLSFTNITGTCRKGITLCNATNVNLSKINVTGFEGPLITTENVTGTGLAAPSASARNSK
jgi:polygalacturonase